MKGILFYHILLLKLLILQIAKLKLLFLGFLSLVELFYLKLAAVRPSSSAAEEPYVPFGGFIINNFFQFSFYSLVFTIIL